MNVSYEWLRALVPFRTTPAELRDIITSRVATVDELVPLRADLAPIVVARVVESQKIPDTKLTANRVDAGNGALLDVVCGAPNVTVGKLYPFAPAGTTMPSSGSKAGITLERRKIRGFVSNGMLCSASELALGADADGIMELDLDVPTGTPLLRALPVGDTRIVIDVMPNRPDLLSHLGVAREIAAATALELALPALDGADAVVPPAAHARGAGTTGGVPVRVDEAELAPRYMGCVIRGVRVGPSPEWLVRRLESVGSRSINNVVDATNYVLHELGQPTHAFDLAKLGGGSVVVRRARAGERLTTLDGAERVLDDTMTVIADAERPQAVAGIMGGRDSEVTETTTDIFLEVAIFDPVRTRTTRRKLGLSTDASYRFERGVDPELPPRALERVARLIIGSAGGAVDGAPVDIGGSATAPAPIALRATRLARLLGEPVPADEAASLLRSVGFDASLDSASEVVRVVAPSWRRDIGIEADLVEEVARLRGYASFPSEIRPFRPGNALDDPLWLLSRRVREALVGAGLLETRPLPFVRGADTGYTRVTNPLAENEPYLRREVLESLSGRAEHNLAHMQGNVRLFEIGDVFLPEGGPLPREELHVGALIMGRRQPPHFSDPKSEEFERWSRLDEWDAKSLAELIAGSANGPASVALEPASADDDASLLWRITVDGEPRGVVRRMALDAPVWSSPAFGVELTLGLVSSEPVAARGRHAHGVAAATAGLSAGDSRAMTYRPLPAQPAAEFDLALLVPEATPAAAVEATIRRAAGDLLEQLELVDLYTGEKIEPGRRSLAWRLILRHPERTLGPKEIEGRRARILRTLEAELNVRQRSA